MYRFIGMLLLGLLAWQSVVAETMLIGTLPNRPTKLGYTLDIHVEAVSGNGYLPMQLKFSPVGKTFRRDRHVEVLLTPAPDYPRFDYTCRTALRLPEGSAALSKTIYVPQYHDWQGIKAELREDGRPVEWGKNTLRNGATLRYRFANQQVTVGIIQPRDWADADAAWKVYPDVRTLVTVLGDGPLPEKSFAITGNPNIIDRRLSHQYSLELAKQVQPAWVQFRPISESNLPDSWLGYSQLDVIIAPEPVIDRIADEQPQGLAELNLWIAAGGNLWLYAAGQGSGTYAGTLNLQPVSPHRLVQSRAVQKLLDLNARNDTTKLIADGWNGVTKESLHYSYQNTNTNTSMTTRDSVFTRLIALDHPFANLIEASALASGLKSSPFGTGQIIAIRAADPFPGSYQLWKSIANLPGPNQLHWATRNGVDVPNGNESYWGWLIRSVGQPPVKSFVLLNVLFAVFIGPICYRFLLRRQRLYLLYFVAPCVAMLVTGALFTYALLVDGVTTKQRTRQITWIDPISKHHVSQCRSTYYRVLGYGQRIEVSSETAIYPVRHSPIVQPYYAGNNAEPRMHGTYTNTGQRQLLGGGFLPTRNQVQFIATLPQSSDRSIKVSWESKTVTNGLPHRIHQLIVNDEDGKSWEASDLAAQSSGLLKPCSRVSDQLEQMLNANVLPEGSEIPDLNRGNWYGSDKIVSYQSLLERRLKNWSKRVPTKSFIGIAELDREQLGVSQASVLDSVHVIMGSLP